MFVLLSTYLITQWNIIKTKNNILIEKYQKYKQIYIFY